MALWSGIKNLNDNSDFDALNFCSLANCFMQLIINTSLTTSSYIDSFPFLWCSLILFWPRKLSLTISRVLCTAKCWRKSFLGLQAFIPQTIPSLFSPGCLQDNVIWFLSKGKCKRLTQQSYNKGSDLKTGLLSNGRKALLPSQDSIAQFSNT